MNGEQFLFTQLPQYAIDVNSGQSQCVGKNELAQRALGFSLSRVPNQAEPLRHFHEEVRGAFGCCPAANVKEMLDHQRVSDADGMAALGICNLSYLR